MRVLALLNRDGGTLKTTDLDELGERIQAEFEFHGHSIEVDLCHGPQIVPTLAKAARRTDIDVLLVGGGDGTVSAAASVLHRTNIALAILPAGTMNLFARTLQIPLEPEDAIAALASGRRIAVDYATANGEPFVHQYAIGLHARMVRMREGIEYGSRIGKIFATSRAVWLALRRLPRVEVTLDIDGETRTMRSTAVAVSNNLYGPGHIPYADDPLGGRLGIYICTEKRILPVMKLTLDIMVGTWRHNPALSVTTAERMEILYAGRNRTKRAVRDGELQTLDERTVVEIHPRGLNVLVPTEATYLKDHPDAEPR